MAVTVKVTKRPPSFAARIKFADAALMQDVGDLALSIIRRRTQAGKSVDGTAFHALSPAYAKAKGKATGNTSANLTVSGRMLNDMTTTHVESRKVTLGFVSQGGKATGGTFIQRSRAVGANDKALYHDQLGAGKSRVKRPFFGLSPAEEKQISDRVDKHIAAQVAKVRN